MDRFIFAATRYNAGAPHSVRLAPHPPACLLRSSRFRHCRFSQLLKAMPSVDNSSRSHPSPDLNNMGGYTRSAAYREVSTCDLKQQQPTVGQKNRRGVGCHDHSKKDREDWNVCTYAFELELYGSLEKCQGLPKIRFRAHPHSLHPSGCCLSLEALTLETQTITYRRNPSQA